MKKVLYNLVSQISHQTFEAHHHPRGPERLERKVLVVVERVFRSLVLVWDAWKMMRLNVKGKVLEMRTSPWDPEECF